MVLDTFDDGMGARGRSLWAVGARPPTTARTVSGYPLPDIPLDLPLYATDFEMGAAYPPVRARSRQQVLGTLRRLWLGDFSDFVDDPPTVVVNYFARTVEILSSLMVSTGPPPDVADQIQQMVSSLLIYGRGYFLYVDDTLSVPEPQNVWRSADDTGTVFMLSQYVSADSPDGDWDRALVYTASDGGVVVEDVALVDDRFGESAGQMTYAGGWSSADRPPIDRDWGESAFKHLIPLVVPMCMRLSGIQHVLDYHEAPTLLMPGDQADMSKILTLGGDPTTQAGIGKPFIQEQTKLILENDSLWIPDGTIDPKYLTWDGQLDSSFMQIETLKAELRMMTGVPAALEQEGGDVPSGAALREMFAVLYWTAGQLHSRVLAALEQVLGRPVDWRSPFDDDPDALPPEPPEPAPVPAVADTGDTPEEMMDDA